MTRRPNKYRLSDDETQIFATDKHGHVFVISAEDEHLLNDHRFCRNSSGYFETRSDYKLVRLHKLIMGTSGEVDHINGKPWDNRRENLRICSHSQNLQNKKIQINNRLGVKGVFQATGRRKYTAKIMVGGKNITLGQYDTVEQAKAEYDKAARHHFGEFARIA